MKLHNPKSLAFLLLLVLVHCSHAPQKISNLRNPWEDKMLAMEIQLKDQAQEISRLKSLIAKNKTTAATRSSEEPTLGNLLNGKASVEPIKKVPTVKLSANKSEDADLDSPLIQQGEAIVDSSQESMQTYYQGLELLAHKKYEQAADQFKLFIQQNPEHVYADRAQFLVVESCFKNKDFATTVVEAAWLENKFPFSLKMAETLYIRGLSFVEMKQVDQARRTFNQLFKNFPKDKYSIEAQKKWAALGIPSGQQLN